MNLTTKIKQTSLELSRLEKVARRLETLDAEIQRYQHTLDGLVKKVDEEATDIETLNKNGLTSLFYKVLGSKEKQMEKERQELLQANLKFDEARKSLELLEYERKILSEKAQDIAGTQKRLTILLKEREAEILANQPKLANKIYHLDDQVTAQNRLIFEMEEAIAVGLDAIQLMDGVVQRLTQAINWGRWDMAGSRGRGRMSSHMKHQQIDIAKDFAYKAQRSLDQFARELRDVYQHQNFYFKINFDSFSSFTDVFFDNLITDWIVQQKINNTLNGVTSVRDKTYRLVESMRVDIPGIEQTIQDLGEERKQIIGNII